MNDNRMFKFCCRSCGQLFYSTLQEFRLWQAWEIETPNICFDCELEQENYEYSESGNFDGFGDFSDADPGL
jgi:hypothetical protein